MFEHMSFIAVIFTVACVDLFVHSEQIKFSHSFALERPNSTELKEYFRMLAPAVQLSTKALASLEIFAGSAGFRS